MGISRTRLREALKALAAEGLIEMAPNRGASVYRMSPHEVRETFEFVAGLEAMAGKRLGALLARHLLDKRTAVMEQLATAAAPA